MRFSILPLAVIGLFLGSLPVQAGIDSGGGDVVILPDSSVVLADPFYLVQNSGSFHCKSGEEGHLSPEIEQGLRVAGLLLVRYGAAPGLSTDLYSPNNRALFIEENVLGSNAEYCFVEQLPNHDSDRISPLPVGAEAHALAYTEGWVTWIQKDLFKKLTLRDQIKSIIHERLHGFAGNVPHAPIVAITNGLELALTYYTKELSGERPRLSSEQVATLEDMVVAIENLRLSPRTRVLTASNHYIVANGGGFAHRKSNIAESAFVSVGSYVPEKGNIGEGATLLSSTLCMSFSPYVKAWTIAPGIVSPQPLIAPLSATGYSVGASSVLANSRIERCSMALRIGEAVQIENSVIATNANWSTGLSIGNGSTIKNSVIIGPSRFVLGARGLIRNVGIEFTPDPRYVVSELEFEAGNDVQLSNLKGIEIRGISGAVRKEKKDPKVTVPDRTVIDFKNKEICSDNRGDSIKINKPRVMNSIRDFRKRCP